MGSSVSAVHSQGRDVLAAAIVRAIQGHNDLLPLEALLDGDKERWGQFFVTAAGPELETAHVYVLDITEKRALESQLNSSQKMKIVGQLPRTIPPPFTHTRPSLML